MGGVGGEGVEGGPRGGGRCVRRIGEETNGGLRCGWVILGLGDSLLE